MNKTIVIQGHVLALENGGVSNPFDITMILKLEMEKTNGQKLEIGILREQAADFIPGTQVSVTVQPNE
jgi:hypothetical protein